MFRRFLISCFTFLLFVNVCFAPQLKPTRGTFYIKENWRRNLIALWLFNEGSDSQVFDLSGNSNHEGTLGGTAHFVAGKFGPAIEFDGDSDYISLQNIASLNPGYITVSAWANFDTPTEDSYEVIYARKCSNQGTVLLQRTSTGGPGAGKIYFQVKLAASNNTPRIAESDSAATSAWHHYVGTYDGDKVKLYVDGVLQATTDDTDGVIDSASYNTQYIGVHTNGTSWLDGQIDHMIIWDWALTASEIALLYREFCMFEERAGYLDGVAAAVEYRRRVIIASIQDYSLLSTFLLLSFIFVNRMVRKK